MELNHPQNHMDLVQFFPPVLRKLAWDLKLLLIHLYTDTLTLINVFHVMFEGTYFASTDMPPIHAAFGSLWPWLAL